MERTDEDAESQMHQQENENGSPRENGNKTIKASHSCLANLS